MLKAETISCVFRLLHPAQIYNNDNNSGLKRVIPTSPTTIVIIIAWRNSNCCAAMKIREIATYRTICVRIVELMENNATFRTFTSLLTQRDTENVK